MADMPAGIKIHFNEQNMTKWEVLMDGPDQSIYAVCITAPRAHLQYEAKLTLHLVGRALQARDHIPQRVSLQAPGRVLPHQDLPPQYRPSGAHLLGRPKE